MSLFECTYFDHILFPGLFPCACILMCTKKSPLVSTLNNDVLMMKLIFEHASTVSHPDSLSVSINTHINMHDLQGRGQITLQYALLISIVIKVKSSHWTQDCEHEFTNYFPAIIRYTARFSLHEVHDSQCTLENYTMYSWRTLADVCMESERLFVVPRCSVLWYSGQCGFQAHNSKVPLIVPHSGVLQRSLAAGYYIRATVVLQYTVAHIQYHSSKAAAYMYSYYKAKNSDFRPHSRYTRVRHCIRLW